MVVYLLVKGGYTICVFFSSITFDDEKEQVTNLGQRKFEGGVEAQQRLEGS